MAQKDACNSDKQESQRRQLYVEFEIDIASETSCPLAAFESDVEETRQRLLDGQCHTDTTLATGGCGESCDEGCTEIVHTVSTINPTCICPAFERFDCIPNVTAVTGSQVRVETYLPDREQLTDLVDELKSVSDGVYLRRLKSVESGTGSERTESTVIALDTVTDKQRRAAVKAVAAGYYAKPRETSLEELADDLDVTKSALSQRLKAVESKLAVAAFTESTNDA